jgi:Thiamine monophosphate kinase
MTSLSNVVERLSRGLKRHPRTLLLWSDDAGGIKIGDEYLLVKVDGFAASRALYPWCSYRDFGFKAISSAISDIFTKGCKPYIYAVSIGVKPSSMEAVEELTRGVEDAVQLYGGYIENMDTNVGNDTWIDVFVLATCKATPIPRTARPGDFIVLPKAIGLSYVAYREFEKGSTPRYEEVQAFSCRPRAYAEVVDLIERNRICFRGSIDISDTVYEAFEAIAKINSVGIYMDLDIRRTLNLTALSYADVEGVDPVDVFLKSSEELVPLLIVSNLYVQQVLEEMRSLGLSPTVVGIVTESREISWRGRVLQKTMWNYAKGRIL